MISPDRRESPEYRAELEALQREFDEALKRRREAGADDKLDTLLNADWTFEWYAGREEARMETEEQMRRRAQVEDFWRRWAQAESIDVPAREPRQPALHHYRDLAAEAEMRAACDEWERWVNGEGE